jgi:hypothetical protein
MKKEINYPEVATWFICWSENREAIKSYGVVMPSQTMSTPWKKIDTFLEEADWIEKLKSNGIQIQEKLKDSDIEARDLMSDYIRIE